MRSSAGCSTRATSATSPVARPTSRTRPGSASWSSTGSSAPLSCRRSPSGALRNLTRYRKAQIEERTREVQRLEKVLQDAGIKLSSVATRVLGASGRAMLDALVSGTTDPEVLAELAWGRLRSKLPALRDALEG